MNKQNLKRGTYTVNKIFTGKQTAKQAFMDLILQKAQNEGVSKNNFPNFPVDLEKGSVCNEDMAFSDIRAQRKGESL